jgi:hypothetical protein
LDSQPTHVSELVARPDSNIGYADAPAAGAGGVWFGGDDKFAPIVWHFDFPPGITQDVVSFDNPKRRLTNFETNMRRKRSVINCDNTPSVAWVHRMASRSSSSVSY